MKNLACYTKPVDINHVNASAQNRTGYMSCAGDEKG